MNLFAKFTRWWVTGLGVGVLLVSVSACQPEQDPRALVDAAVEAHGGRERLAAFDNVKIIGRGRFKGQLETTGTISFVAPAAWAVEVRLQGNPGMVFGMDGERCWRRDRQFVSDCSADDEYRRYGQVLRFRLLHGFDAQPLAAAGHREVGGKKAPAVRTGDFVLAFDPVSHLLIQISSGNWAEVYSDFRRVNGAVVATGRTLFIDGALDAEDHWDEILPGEADLDLLHPPAFEDGDLLGGVDPERWVVTALLDDGLKLKPAVDSLDEAARAHGQRLSTSDGLVLTRLSARLADEPGRWEIAVGLEPTTRGLPAAQSNAPFRFERWPEVRFAGIFHRGDPRQAAAKREKLEKHMDEFGLIPAAGSHWQFLCRRESLDAPPGERLYLLRRAVRAEP